MKYDRAEAIDRATGVFWKLGFQGTKMRDLQKHLDMRPGSIYAGFGSKEGLYKEALDFYTEQSVQNVQHYARQHDNPLTALYELVKDQVIEPKSKLQPKNCFLIKTVTELGNSNAEISLWAQAGLARVEEEFALVFEQAKAQGILQKNADCRQLGKLLQVQIMGLRAYSQLQVSRDEMKTMLDDVFSSLPTAA